jgi:hypothetical protein
LLIFIICEALKIKGRNIFFWEAEVHFNVLFSSTLIEHLLCVRLCAMGLQSEIVIDLRARLLIKQTFQYSPGRGPGTW